MPRLCCRFIQIASFFPAVSHTVSNCERKKKESQIFRSFEKAAARRWRNRGRAGSERKFGVRIQPPGIVLFAGVGPVDQIVLFCTIIFLAGVSGKKMDRFLNILNLEQKVISCCGHEKNQQPCRDMTCQKVDSRLCRTHREVSLFIFL